MPIDTPGTGAQTVHPNNKQENVPELTYSRTAQEYINFRRMRMVAARDLRDAPHPEFDDMTFLQWHALMKKADDQYVPPRKNKQDTSINLGTTRDKDSSLLEYAMKYDFEPVAQVYDDTDDMLEQLAETGEDMVRKSKMLEEYRAKAKLIYRSMIAFGTALVEEQWVERWTLQKTLKSGTLGGKAVWEEKFVKTYDGCQAKLWDLRKCYFGDIRKFFMNGAQGQPFFFTVEYESYDVVKQLYQNWERWKYVPNTVVATPEISLAQGIYSQGWTLRPISENTVEIVRYYDPVANEFAITFNGVDMLDIQETPTTEGGVEKIKVSGFPLTEVSPSGAIPVAKFDLEPMHEFAYSKSQPAKMRVLADVENMMMKLFIIMFKQKAKPTMGNKSGRMFGDEITDPATVINDIREGDIFPVLPNFQGAQPADFSMFEAVKKELDKNSVERTFQGQDNPQPQDDTATKTMSDMKAQSLKVAAMFDGIVFGENQLAWLRTHNIRANWTKPIDTQIDVFNKALINKYRSVTVPTEVDGGQKATKKIIFTKGTTMSSQDVHQEELDHQKAKGTEVRKAYLHPELYAAAKLNWFYSTIPVPNDADPLSYLMFAKQIQDAIMFFGPDSLNVKKLKHRFASITGNDFDTWFLGEQELAQNRQQAAQQQQTAAPANAAPKAPAPTIGQTASAAPNVGAVIR